MPGDASETNNVVNSRSEESMKTVSENFDNAPTEKHTGANDNVIDLVDDAGSKEKSAEKVPATNMSKRLRSNSGKGVATASQPTTTPSKGKKASSSTKPVNYGPPRSSSKVAPSSVKGKKSLKRKEPSSVSESEDEVVNATTGGSSRKTLKGKKISLKVSPAPLDNVSFHYESGATRWRF
ncbi:hypothetical protein A2U01_0041992, partial [Trifolium medium]|nr:hypothetical protein [Trifolium medium]